MHLTKDEDEHCIVVVGVDGEKNRLEASSTHLRASGSREVQSRWDKNIAQRVEVDSCVGSLGLGLVHNFNRSD